MRILKYLILFLPLASSVTNAVEVRIAVSDLIADFISEPLQKLAEEAALDIKVISAGSLPAINAICADEISLAVVVAPDNIQQPECLDETFTTLAIAYSTAIIAVNHLNPLEEVSFNDLQGIFGADPDLAIEAWNKLTGDYWTSSPVKPIVMQDDKNIFQELFRHKVLDGDAMRLSVNQVAYSEVEAMLSGNTAAVALLPYLPNNEEIKELMLSTDGESPAFDPTDENIHYGDYPIRLPFHIVYKGAREPELAAALCILLSDGIAKVLSENHLFVPPDAIRTNHIYRLSHY